ncbi:lytic transglycosylase domain-containing protein [Desulfosudis oleivorans]|uniref:Lytic transglycosylase catalytic n=1 Tax=Desulfosudis oleivorans (strain DSM 6200 / JCM 39069 / Hxd3) TaxID=96561 RepID=A8ZXM1_DESOH|nr:lytic transglycosylase domain-containing protein [Desulfosudis oleivorans]ABW66979.1 Lytic transglycosylase catalytic [Desulfosudis oleivorans Hxd3]
MTHYRIIRGPAGRMLLALLFVVAGPSFLNADVYKHIDKDGVLHFTDRPGGDGFYLYLSVDEKGSTAYDRSDYDTWIQEAAGKYRISFGLLKALIKVESNFNARAVSPAGAKGLMQIMPHNFRALDIRDPFDPYQNIMGGARYLREMLNRHNGNLQLALAAYNAGPNAVARYGRVPPYTETMDYVRKVMKYYIVYK